MTEYYLNETVVTFSGNIIQDSTINMLRLSESRRCTHYQPGPDAGRRRISLPD